MSSSLSPEQRKALIQHYIETVWNTQKTGERDNFPWDASDRQSSRQDIPSYLNTLDYPDSSACVYLGEQPLYTPLTEMRKELHAAFPDLHITISDIVVEEEKVAVRWLMQGTDLGGFEGHPPTRRSIRLTGITIIRMEGRTIVEEWNEVDVAGMLHQLGFVFVPQSPRITLRRPRPARPSFS
jgi:predicted ester cyclase